MTELYDDRYGLQGSFQIVECTRCGHKSLDASFSPEELSHLYTNYYPRSSFDLSAFRPAKEIRGFSGWLNGERSLSYSWVPRNVRVLDIGCGFGETLAYHRARGCDVYGVETDDNIRRVADRFGFRVHVGVFDPDLYDSEFFDYVTLDQVIEHVTDPVQTMRGIFRILKTGGIAVVSTPNSAGLLAKLFGRRWIHWHAPYHLQHFSPKSMAAVSRLAGLALERSLSITSSEWLLYQWIHSFTRPPMGIPSPFWSKKDRDLKTTGVIAFFSLLHFLKIDHIMTRMLDALRVGDNMLYFLRKSPTDPLKEKQRP